MMLKKFITLLVLSITLVSTPCNAWFWDKDLSDYKNEFRDSVGDFKEQQTETKIEFKNTKNLIFDFSSMLQKSKKEDMKFGNLHDKWEDTEEEIKDLKDKFISLIKSADNYFNEITKRANSISDSKIKRQLLKRISDSKNKYAKLLKKSKERLIEFEVSHRKVKDVIIFMEITNSLKSLDKELKIKFNEIDQIITRVMQDLDLLYKESQELLDEDL